MQVTNPELQLAAEFVRDTGCTIFLTGKAGTGKTTFLRSLKKESPKRMVVTAPTGVAAINAGGVTLHSFFQLPFGPYIPGSDAPRSQYRFSREKVDIINSLDLLVIDEISMVRADLLDGVDNALRRIRRNEAPFGGVQLLLIGDLYQLPPVVKEDDWQLLEGTYSSPYFFSSTALERTDMVTIELQHIYRQADQRFIDLLNQVRNSRMDNETMTALNARHIADFVPDDQDGYITLSTHNRKADGINASRLAALPRHGHAFTADIDGSFPEHAYPTAATLNLKPGAQVMFVRNDLSPQKRYFNGKIGTVTRISGSDVHVRCPDDRQTIVVEPVTWENIEYALNRETMEITETKVGAFTQYPLRLAWAITIHKSQGLTFERAIIDAQAAFAHGQVYVALSRCRTLEGMVLSTSLSAAAVKTDAAVRHFSQQTRQAPACRDQLRVARIRYQQELLITCFNFRRMRGLLRRTVALLLGNPGVIHLAGNTDLSGLRQTVEDEIFTIGNRFLRQLNGLFANTGLPTADEVVQERISKASAYFEEKMAALLGAECLDLQWETDNTELRKKANRLLKLLRTEVAVKRAGVQSCAHGFSPSDYFRAISTATIDVAKKPAKIETPTYAESDIDHPELFLTLKAWRSRQAEAEGVPHYRVLHQKTLIQIAVHLPNTLSALNRIKGIGKRLSERYGEALVALVEAYRQQEHIEDVALPATPTVDATTKTPKAPRMDTKQASLDLFNKGLTLDQIAAQRGLVRSTIEGHMAHWVETGDVAIDTLVPADMGDAIERALSSRPKQSVAAVKQTLGDEISYGHIRLVQAHLNRKKRTHDD